MPEKIMKMYAWDVSGGYISDKSPGAKYTKWMIAGGIAGAATTVVGNLRMHSFMNTLNILLYIQAALQKESWSLHR